MFKVCGSLELSVDDLKKCFEGSALLSSALRMNVQKMGNHRFM